MPRRHFAGGWFGESESFLDLEQPPMERVQKSRKTIEPKGLDKAVLDSALDRLIETMDGVNRELDALLAKARGE